MIRRVLAIATLLIPALCAACGGVDADTKDGGPEDAGACPDGGIAPSCGPACTDTPRLVVDGSTFVSPEAGPVGVEVPPLGVRGTDLFYAVNVMSGDTTSASLMRVSLGGGQPALLASSSTAIGPFLVTATGILFAQGAVVVRVPLEGGTPSVLVTGAAPIAAWATDGESLYFSDGSGTKGVPLAGGTAQTITTLSAQGDLAVAGGDLFLLDASHTLWSVPVKGGTPVTLATQQTNLTLLTSCGASLCWIDFDGFESPGVLESLAPGGAPTPLATSQLLTEAVGMVFDGSDFFTTAGGGGAVARVPAAGGTPVALASGGGGLAVDESCLYWSDFQGIHSVVKTVSAQ
jgi:hypothetical protein